MNSENITSKQGISMVVMFIIGSAIVLGPGSEAKQDVWIANLLAILMAIPAIFVYARILSVFPGRDLIDILQDVFGKAAGGLIALLYAWYAFHLGALVLRNFTEFIQIVSMPETPQYVIIAFYGLLCIWVVRSGLTVLGRWVALLFPIILIVTIGITFLSVTKFELSNIKPVLYNGISQVLGISFTVFSFPLAETVLFSMVFYSIKGKFSTYKVYYAGLFIGVAILLITSVRNVLILGDENVSAFYFPSYSSVSMVNIGDFLQRIEVFIAITYLFTGFVKISVCLYAASNGLAKTLGTGSHSSLAAPVGLFMMCLASFIYNNTMEMFDWASKIYKYYAIPYQIVLPVIILIAVEIKTRIKSRKVVA